MMGSHVSIKSDHCHGEIWNRIHYKVLELTKVCPSSVGLEIYLQTNTQTDTVITKVQSPTGSEIKTGKKQ